jgi:hypothetical protein
MLTTGPGWLDMARLHGAKKTVEDIKKLASANREVFKVARQNGEVDLDALLGGIRNESLGPCTKHDMPKQLAEALTGISDDYSFDTHLIQFESTPNKFAVTDLSYSNGFKGLKPTKKEYGNLTSKFVETMREVSLDGRPLALNAGLQKSSTQF